LILQNPDKVYKQLGKQYRFGEPIERPNGANKTAVSPETGPETSPNLPEPATKTPAAPASGGKNLQLSCGAKCGISLKNYKEDSSLSSKAEG
ncbi:MAG: hypothetical protein AB7E49_10860, partial [Campylobacterales bacterium]